MTTRELRINGADVEVEVRGLESLATVLREQLALTGTKIACGRGECGACTVLVGGLPVMACVLPVAVVDGAVETIEGVAPEVEDLRAEFADTGAFQCGFCTPGQLVHATALLRQEPDRADEDYGDHVRQQLSGNLCRCTGYQAIVGSVCAVAARRRGARS